MRNAILGNDLKCTDIVFTFWYYMYLGPKVQRELGFTMRNLRRILIITSLYSKKLHAQASSALQNVPESTFLSIKIVIFLLRTLRSHLLISTMSSFVFSAIPVVIVCK